MENRVDKLVELILENDLLFDVVTTWRSLPVFYKIWESDDLYRMHMKLSESDIEDYYSVADKITKELQVYYGDSFCISADYTIKLLDIHRETILKAMEYEPDKEITIEVEDRRYSIEVRDLCKFLLNYAVYSSNKIKLVKIN